MELVNGSSKSINWNCWGWKRRESAWKGEGIRHGKWWSWPAEAVALMVPKEFQCKRPRSEIGEGERTPTGIFLPFAGLFSHHPTKLPLKLRLLHVQTVTEIRPFAWSRSFLPRAELLAVSFLSPYQQHPCCCQVFGRCRYLSFFLSFFFLFWKSLLLLTLERPRSY